MQLSELGDRICILGPSNSGKSTLADAISRQCGLPAVHLDQYYHLPNTDWMPRPFDEFRYLHDKAIQGDQWVMDGNYSKLTPQRFARATGLIVLEVSTLVSLTRYVRRSLFEADRQGALEGGRDSVKWNMIRHIVITTPSNRRRYAELFEQSTLPKIRLASLFAVNQAYKDWALLR